MPTGNPPGAGDPVTVLVPGDVRPVEEASVPATCTVRLETVRSPLFEGER